MVYRHLGEIVLFFGPPCVGKDTQAKLYVAANPDVFHFSTGDGLRQLTNVKDPSTLDPELQNIRERLAKGGMAPSQIVMDLTYTTFNNARMPQNQRMKYCRFILNGAPRLEDQIEPIDQMGTVRAAYYFDAPDDSLLQRMLNRRDAEIAKAAEEKREPKLRSDDNPEVFVDRLKIYKSDTLKILEYYGNRVTKIDSNRPIDEIQKEVRCSMKRHFKKQF